MFEADHEDLPQPGMPRVTSSLQTREVEVFRVICVLGSLTL